jgi:hypothetical protein
MKTYPLTIQQYTFLKWVNRNYEWMKTKGYKTTYQPFQHRVHRMMVSSEYTEEDKLMMDGVRRFLGGIGLKTYNRDWTWDRSGAELDWLVNTPMGGYMSEKDVFGW